MVTLEQVERLREKANVSFEDAKNALEAAEGDLLNALIYLEKQGNVAPPPGNGFYSSQNGAQTEEENTAKNEKHDTYQGESFGDMMKRFGRFCGKVLHKGNTNYLEAEKGDSVVFSMPVTVVIVLTAFLFWVVVPLFIISLFCGLRYRFRGKEFGRDAVNKVMDGASNTVDDIKRTIQNEK
ncbi:MAG TPA: ubiquitin [Clostridiales bacterium]|nr:ubiquitin [Clostridiales bacterium]